MADKVTASAPGKLVLFGEHAVVYGKPCIVTAVDQRLYVTVTKNGENAFHLSAPDLGLTAYSKTIDKLGGEGLPTGVRFIEVLYKRFLNDHPQTRGIDVVTRSEFSSSFGFGSSSAATVAFAMALFAVYGVEVSKQELFEICYQTVLEVQGVGSGFDVAAAIWGGTLYYVSPGKVVEQIKTGELPIVVGYTGIKADTPTLVRQVAEFRRKNPKTLEGVFNQIGVIVDKAKKALEEKNATLLGSLMNENQQLLAELGVSSVELDTLNQAAVKAGALGAKLSGAGGGDCMIAVSQQSYGMGYSVLGIERSQKQNKNKYINIDKVRTAINQRGQWLDVKLGAEGARLEAGS